MAILKNTVQVNNGNTGWTSSHVLDALEETFGDLGWNSGSQVNGRVTTCCAPGDNDPWANSQWDSKWATCGGPAPTTDFNNPETEVRYFIFDDEVNETFSFRRAYYITQGQEYSSGNTDDYVNITDHGFNDGDAFLYYQGITNKNATTPLHLYSGATNGDTLYVSVNDANSVCLHTDQADALGGTNKLDLTNISSGYYIVKAPQTTLDDIRQGDMIRFISYNTTTTTEVYIQDSAGAVDVNRLLNNDNYNVTSYKVFPDTDSLVATADAIRYWDTQGWEQGTYYLTGDAATYSVAINILPSARHYAWGGFVDTTNPDTIRPAYFDYTVPQSGSKSALNLRIYRRGDVNGQAGEVLGIEVLDLTSSGWAEGDTFTIPGTAIGGTSPENDILFGTNTAETATGAKDGICSIKVTNFGAGTNAYLKNYSTKTLFVRLENDASKNYGTTFWNFQLKDNDYQLTLTPCIDPEFRSYDPMSSDLQDIGRRGGVSHLDYSASVGDQFNYNNMYEYQYTGSSTPTAYPLKIVTYRAQAPQDTDFAVIQFIQSINSVDTPYLTFSINKGTIFGQNVWDLDDVWQGTYTCFKTDNHTIRFDTSTGYYYTSGEGSNYSTYRMLREASYGYTRDYSDSIGGINTDYASNRYRDNNQDYETNYSYSSNDDHVIYYRDNLYDKAPDTSFSGNSHKNRNDFDGTGEAVAASANFDRVMKGIPLADGVSPSLYYLPDDFVLIDFNYTPGATNFLPGDTITISASEVYEVILGGYTTQATTYDGIDNNSVHGILFCARTT